MAQNIEVTERDVTKQNRHKTHKIIKLIITKRFLAPSIITKRIFTERTVTNQIIIAQLINWSMEFCSVLTDHIQG